MGEIVRSTGVRSLLEAANFKCEGPGAGGKSAGLEKSAVVATDRKESRRSLMWQHGMFTLNSSRNISDGSVFPLTHTTYKTSLKADKEVGG